MFFLNFFGSKEYKNYDVTLAMYHDQALIPLKLLAFSDTINFTLGLPIIRTSPGHGTGIEIAKDFGSENSGKFVNGVLGSLLDNSNEIITNLRHNKVLK